MKHMYGNMGDEEIKLWLVMGHVSAYL